MSSTLGEIEAFVLQALSRTLRRNVGADQVDQRLDQLGLDSLALLGLVGEIEDRFALDLGGLDFPPNASASSISAIIRSELER